MKKDQILGYLQSKQGKVTLNYMYGWGAAVVIIGALFKIRHLPGADFFLTLGLGTEALIFFVSGFEKPAEEVDWSLVYPELAGAEAKAQPATLDGLMREASLSKDVLENLGQSFRSLNQNVKQMGDLNSASLNSSEFASKVKDASDTVGQLAVHANSASHALEGMSDLGIHTTTYHEEMGKLTNALILANQSYGQEMKVSSEAMSNLVQMNEESQAYRAEMRKLVDNLSTFNAIYDSEMKQTAAVLKSANEHFGGMGRMMDSLRTIQEDAERYQNEMSRLNRNIAALNSVYGNMLNAMSNRY